MLYVHPPKVQAAPNSIPQGQVHQLGGHLVAQVLIGDGRKRRTQAHYRDIDPWQWRLLQPPASWRIRPPSAETFEAVSTRFLKHQKPRLTPRAYTRESGIIKAHLKPFFGTAKLAEVRRADVQKYMTHRSGEGTAQSIIDDAEGIERTGKPMNKVGEAETFLHEELKNGPRAAREMIELARQLGIGVKSLERAREKRGIVTSKAGKDAGWMWHYPFTLS